MPSCYGKQHKLCYLHCSILPFPKIKSGMHGSVGEIISNCWRGMQLANSTSIVALEILSSSTSTHNVEEGHTYFQQASLPKLPHSLGLPSGIELATLSHDHSGSQVRMMILKLDSFPLVRFWLRMNTRVWASSKQRMAEAKAFSQQRWPFAAESISLCTAHYTQNQQVLESVAPRSEVLQQRHNIWSTHFCCFYTWSSSLSTGSGLWRWQWVT